MNAKNLKQIVHKRTSRVAKHINQYKYDWLGRRVRKLVYEDNELSETICYQYDGDQVLTEFDENGTLLRRFIYGAGIDEPVAMLLPDSGWYFYHYDGLGNVIALSDWSGEIVEQCSYDVFGEPSCVSETNPYKFTGRRYDAETGLYYYRERYYSPELGRFLQPDPIGYDAGLNLYTYCDNNPTNWIDPFGLEKVSDPNTNLTKPEDIDSIGTWYAPGKTPPSWWPNPGKKWKWDSQGFYKRRGKRKHWHKEEHGPGHWETEDSQGNRIEKEYPSRGPGGFGGLGNLIFIVPTIILQPYFPDCPAFPQDPSGGRPISRDFQNSPDWIATQTDWIVCASYQSIKFDYLGQLA